DEAAVRRALLEPFEKNEEGRQESLHPARKAEEPAAVTDLPRQRAISTTGCRAPAGKADSGLPLPRIVLTLAHTRRGAPAPRRRKKAPRPRGSAERVHRQPLVSIRQLGVQMSSPDNMPKSTQVLPPKLVPSHCSLPTMRPSPQTGEQTGPVQAQPSSSSQSGVQPSPSSSLPSSHSSPVSVTLSPQNAGTQEPGRQASGWVSLLLSPSSQTSPVSITPSPQYAMRQLVRHASTSVSLLSSPSSHSSRPSTTPSPHSVRVQSERQSERFV